MPLVKNAEASAHNFLKEIRVEKGISQARLAKLAKVSLGTISRIEHHCPATDLVQAQIAKSLDCTVEEIFPYATGYSRKPNQAPVSWEANKSYLESLFQDTKYLGFSLEDWYIPRFGYQHREKVVWVTSHNEYQNRSIFEIFELEKSLYDWHQCQDDDFVAIIGGGLGSGKTSFAKHFAQRIQKKGNHVLYVHASQVPISSDPLDSLGSYFLKNGLFKDNPLVTNILSDKTLLILDGLEHWVSYDPAGKYSLLFLNDLIKTLKAIDRGKNILKILGLAHTVIVKHFLSTILRPQQIRHLLPFAINEKFFTKKSPDARITIEDSSLFLNKDFLSNWFQRLIDKKFIRRNTDEAIEELKSDDLYEATSHPLFITNLVSQHLESVTQRPSLHLFARDIIEKAYYSEWNLFMLHFFEKPVYYNILEDLALLTWHQGHFDSRTFSHDTESYPAIKILKDPAKFYSIVSSFFFTCPQESNTYITFEFSFIRDYLRAVSILKKIAYFQQKYTSNFEYFSLKFLEIMGPSPLYLELIQGLSIELSLLDRDKLKDLQRFLCHIFDFILDLDFPAHRLQISYRSMSQYARNAGEGLLVLINLISKLIGCTTKLSKINIFYKWFKITLAGSCLEKPLAKQCLSFMDFSHCSFVEADLSHTIANHALFRNADLTKANFKGASLKSTVFEDAILTNANFTGANLEGAIFKTDTSNACFQGAKIKGAVGLSEIDHQSSKKGVSP